MPKKKFILKTFSSFVDPTNSTNLKNISLVATANPFGIQKLSQKCIMLLFTDRHLSWCWEKNSNVEDEVYFLSYFAVSMCLFFISFFSSLFHLHFFFYWSYGNNANLTCNKHLAPWFQWAWARTIDVWKHNNLNILPFGRKCIWNLSRLLGVLSWIEKKSQKNKTFFVWHHLNKVRKYQAIQKLKFILVELFWFCCWLYRSVVCCLFSLCLRLLIVR